MNIKIKDYYKVMLCFLFFFMGGTIAVLTLRAIGFEIAIKTSNDLVLLDFSISLLITLMFSTIYFKVLKQDFKKLKGKYGKFLLKAFVAFSVLMVIKMFSGKIESLIASMIHVEHGISSNQANIEYLLGHLTAMMIISSVIFTPIREEVLFRCGIKQIIKNKRVFVTVSGLIFGFMHVTSSLTFLGEILLLGVVIDIILRSDMKKGSKAIVLVTSITAILICFGFIYYFQYGDLLMFVKTFNINEVISSIMYILAGMYFAYLYHQSDNIWLSIATHALNNGFSVAILLLN